MLNVRKTFSKKNNFLRYLPKKYNCNDPFKFISLNYLVADGLLNHENEELRDRVSALEKNVQQHEDEILCLKSALSDALRRLSAVESGKGKIWNEDSNIH